MKKAAFILILSLAFMAGLTGGAAARELPREDTLVVFFSPTCHRCMQIKSEVMPGIEKDFPGIRIQYKDISEIENYKLMVQLKERHGSTIENVMPVFYFKGHLLNGTGRVEKGLRALISGSLHEAPRRGSEASSVDLIAYFKSFQPLAVAGAGLTDGINPCAFTVIVFFISFLSLQGYRKREVILIGLTFVFAVFMTYLAIGIGLFGFLYRAGNFWMISKIFNLSVGALSILLGSFALYDFFKFKKTKDTKGLLLQLPEAVKRRIHSVIGQHYRTPKTGQNLRPHLLKLALSALTVGFLVSLLEAVCTGQVYLPTITFVLKTTRLKFQAVAYLLLYNLMFIVPLLIVFLLALLGVTSEQFSRAMRKHLGTVKILMAALFFALGVFLLWRP